MKGIAMKRFNNMSNQHMTIKKFARAFIAAAIGLGSSARATDYSFGSVTENFNINATDQCRSAWWEPSKFYNNEMGVEHLYVEGNKGATYTHFNLSSLGGKTISGSVNLNFTVAEYGGGYISNGQVSTADTEWTFSSGGTTPVYTAIPGSTGPNGTFANGTTATWTIGQSAFQGYVDNQGAFYGLVVSAELGSTATLQGTPSLTGITILYDNVKVTGGTDWSAASWNGGTSTLAISGSGNVSGGNVSVHSGATVSVTDSATLGSGNFAGNFESAGMLSFGSSVDQTLGGIISGGGSLAKSGAGTLILTGTNTYGGTTTVSNGTLRIDGDSSAATGAMTVFSGASLGGHGSYGGNITLNDGAALNCDLTLTDSTLTCGQLSFINLDFADCTFTVAQGGGAFTLIEAASLGTVTFANAEGKINGVSSKLYISGNKLMLMVGLGTRISIF